jgi:ABC-type bacteriocin/lantibiotic exporter with double-glycine peptidase domain
MQKRFILNSPVQPPSLLRKLVAVIITIAMFALVLMFSAVVLVVVVIVGTLAGAYLWWKTRALRKQMRDAAANQTQREEVVQDDQVFEGEVIRVVDTRD